MGLEAFDVAPDNKGGRKESRSADNRQSKSFDRALTLSKDSESYWRQLLNEHSIAGKPEGADMAILCNETQLLPRTVRSKLHEHGIFEYEEIKKQELQDSGLEPDTDSSLVSFVHDAKE
jgi:hypothetical protein